MLNRKHFDRNLSALLLFKGVKQIPQMDEMLYNLIKNDFTDERFGNRCIEICKTKELYNKYPDPKLFYDTKTEEDPNVLVCIDSGYLDISKEANDCISKMSDKKYNTMIDWIRRNINGKTMKKSKLSEIIIGFYSGGIEQPRENEITFSEIKQLLADHYGEEDDVL